MNRSLSSSAIGVLCIVVATLCFAFQGILIKKLFTLNITVHSMLLWRQVMFLPIYLFYLVIWKPDVLKPMGTDTFKIMAVGLIGFFFIPAVNFSALKNIEAGIERILLYTYPIFVVVLHALWVRRWPSRSHIVALIIVQVGIFLLIGGGESLEKLKLALLPALQVLFAAVMFALYTILLRQWVEKYGSRRFFLYGILGAFICICLTYLLLEHPKTLPGAEAFFYLFIMMLISFPPSILFAEGVGRIGSTRASFISTLGPVATLIAADLLLGERLMLSQVAGGIIVLVMVSSLEAEAIRSLWQTFRARRK